MCRSRRELSNAYLIANIGFDTAENEPCKVCPIERCSGKAGEARDARGALRHGLAVRRPTNADLRAGGAAGGAAPGEEDLLTGIETILKYGSRGVVQLS